MLGVQHMPCPRQPPLPTTHRCLPCLPSLPACLGLPAEEVLERDFFMSAPEAHAFGIVDEVIQQRPPLDEEGGAQPGGQQPKSF